MGPGNRPDPIYMIPVRGSLPPPPPSHGMVPKPAFCSILHENVVFAVFLARWLAGAVCKPANSQEFLQQTFRKRVICNVSGSENVLFAILYLSIILSLSSFLLKELVFRVQILLVFLSWHAPILCCLISTYFISPYQLRCCVLEIGRPRPLAHRAHPFHRGERVITVLSISWIYRHFPFVILFDLVFNIWS